MQVDASVAGYAAEEVLDGAAVSHELMSLHQGQIDDGVGVHDGFGQIQPLQRRVGLEFDFDHFVLGEVDDFSACRFNCILNACFLKRCPAGIVEAVGFAHDDFAVAIAEQANDLAHDFGAGDDAGQVFGMAEVGFNVNPFFATKPRVCRLPL